MTMPDFQAVMLPILDLAADGAEHTMAEAFAKLADHFQLTEAERSELLPGGSQRRFHNRVYWAVTHLRAAGLVVRPARGRFQITDAGRDVLSNPPPKITIAFLSGFPGYKEFKAGTGSAAGSPVTAAPATAPQTPDEVIAAAYKQLFDDLADEVLDRVVASPPDFLERLVIQLLRSMGYGGLEDDAAIVVGGPGDEGIDGIIKQDKLGLDLIYIQAKRWNHSVSSPDIRNFIGSLQIKSANRGIFITTSAFTSDARDAAQKGGKQIVLIDGATLARLMIENNVGVTTRGSFDLKRLDTGFFDEGS
jgi:restriction system protein